MVQFTLPTTRENSKPHLQGFDVLKEMQERQRQKQMDCFDCRLGVRDIPLLEPGDVVWLSDWQRMAQLKNRLVLTLIKWQYPLVNKEMAKLDDTETV
uniref:Uncharacterized protein n=1 Tax=Amphimedon queenslandica TaxID=400682 RepID=A0A1X7UJQ3_AMPQE